MPTITTDMISATVAAIATTAIASDVGVDYDALWRAAYNALPEGVDCDPTVAAHQIATATMNMLGMLLGTEVLGGNIRISALRREAEKELDREVAAALVAAVLTARRLRAEHDQALTRLRDEWADREAELMEDGGLC